ncbi:MAG TPA: hypothetical protein VLD63_14290 [Anaerolineales bacterium]|nr:hypothetical protein [Anaerolineales bacterium]
MTAGGRTSSPARTLLGAVCLALIAPWWGARLPAARVEPKVERMPRRTDTSPLALRLTLADCAPTDIAGACARIPDLVVELDGSGQDLSSYEIHAESRERKAVCPAPTCTVHLEPTSFDGIEIKLWAETADHKRKAATTASVRVLPVGDTTENDSVPWYVQVLSPQWAGEPVDACAVAWDAFPPIGDAPTWLTTPDDVDALASDVIYHFLASKLITLGAVEVGECPDGGLTVDGAPTACGAEKAAPLVADWQNRFDEAILEAARDERIPAFLLKRLIAEESQFWPATNVERGEYGLGHLTEPGADNTLLWNKEFYDSYCPSVLGEVYCGRGYAQQSDYRRSLMRGSILASLDADCPDCEWGIDFDVARDGIPILGETVLAYCSQTGRMVANVTREAPGRTTSYEDMWRISLASYAAGPGCVAKGLKDASKKGEVIAWSSVSNEFTPACAGAGEYVEHISR